MSFTVSGRSTTNPRLRTGVRRPSKDGGCAEARGGIDIYMGVSLCVVL